MKWMTTTLKLKREQNTGNLCVTMSFWFVTGGSQFEDYNRRRLYLTQWAIKMNAVKCFKKENVILMFSNCIFAHIPQQCNIRSLLTMTTKSSTVNDMEVVISYSADHTYSTLIFYCNKNRGRHKFAFDFSAENYFWHVSFPTINKLAIFQL